MGSKLSESLKCWQMALFILTTWGIMILSGVRGEGGGTQGQLEFGLIVEDFT